jgi:hypothetical protein
MTEEIISDLGRLPVVVQRRQRGGLLLHTRQMLVALSEREVDRLIEFALHNKKPTATTPAKARLQRFPMTPKCRTESPETDE